MSYTFPFTVSDNVIELGGGNRPYFRPNLDVRSGENIDIVADFNKILPLESNSYSGVFSCYCIEHLSWRKVRLFISEVYRILKQNGKAVFITANTEKQMQYVLAHDEWNDDCSCIIFGDQDYPENTHMNSLCPRYAIKLLSEAGFSNIIVMPHGALGTDMIIEAQKTNQNIVFDRNYFDNPHFYGENTGFYRDHPTNWIVFNKLMENSPNSVLELGCGRGFLLKRFESKGIKVKGLDISKHCYLTRVTDAVQIFDIRNTPWPFKDKEFDLCFSQGVFDFIDIKHHIDILNEIDRVSKSGIHSFDTKEIQGLYKNQVFLDNKEIVAGNLPLSVPLGDDKLKLNIGSFTVMLHHGWVNTDVINLQNYAIQNQYKFLQMDSTKPLPFDANTVDYIVSSHMLEHLSWEEGFNFLKECHRIMKLNAVMRIAVPDAELLTKKYLAGNLHELDEMNIVAATNSSESFKLWSFMVDGHKTAYDWNGLKSIGELAGFKVELRKFNEGNAEILSEAMDYMPEISIYVEMTKLV